MQVTKAGTFEKAVSATAFKMAVGMKSYEVKTDAMTHVTADGKGVKLVLVEKGRPRHRQGRTGDGLDRGYQRRGGNVTAVNSRFVYDAALQKPSHEACMGAL